MALFKAGAPEELAERLAFCSTLRCSSPTSRWSPATAKADLLSAAKAFFAVTDAFRISHIEDAAGSIVTVRLL